MKPVVLSIAGSDSSGGAGIQADVRTITTLGAWPATVVTAVTAQDAAGVTASVAMDLDLVRAQLRAAFGGLDVVAAKTGMLATAGTVRAVAEALSERRLPHVVCDPVLLAGQGQALLEDDAVDVLLAELLPAVTLITPNTREAERLTGRSVRTAEDAARAGSALVERGAGAALVTGGHLDDEPGTDVLVADGEVRVFAGEWIDTGPVHGTGCVLSAALAARLAAGVPLVEAVTHARAFVRDAIRAAQDHGAGFRSADPSPATAEQAPIGRNP